MYQKTVKTLDLSAFIEKTFDITLLDGSVVNLRRPTKAIAIQLQQLSELDATDCSDEMEKKRRDLIVDILHAAFNNNIEARTFERSEIDEMPDVMLVAIITAYFGFLKEILSAPNSQSLSSPAKAKGAKNSLK